MVIAATTRRILPWNDRAGRFAPLKAIVLALVALPALHLLWRAFDGTLGGRPLTQAIHTLGDWTIYLLLITLAVTPARRLFNWPKLIQVRRILGIAALLYIAAHFGLYVVDSRLDLAFVAQEIVLRVYLLIGFVALLGLVALGVTSTDGMIRRMGAIRWNRLHRLIYILTALGLLHYFMQSKIDVSQPVLMTGFFLWLMGWRLMAARGVKQGLLPLAGLSVVAALATAAVEAAWYQFATPVGGWRLLMANLDFSVSIRPAWWVLSTGLAVTILSEIRTRAPPLHPRLGQATEAQV